MSELNRHIAAFENDEGSTKLIGFAHSGPGRAIVQKVLTNYMTFLDAEQYSDDGWSADVENLLDHGVPIIHQIIEDSPKNDFYYKYHHTAGDSMTIMNPDDMDSNVLGIATFLYIIADLEVSLRSVTSEIEDIEELTLFRKDK
jgi:carboxypeptidase Q